MTYKTDRQQALFAPFVGEVPVESRHHTTQKVPVIAPEEITTIEISFYDHEVYAGDKLIACITYDQNDFVTQPWLVMVNGAEIHCANSWMQCYSYIQWHYKRGTLPIQKQDFDASVTTDNEVMAEIANECERFELDLYDDGIYHNDIKLGEIGCSNGNWWVLQASSQEQEKLPCNSASDALWCLWMLLVKQGKTSVITSVFTINEELLDRPFDELTLQQWRQLKEYESLPEESENMILVAA
ncbi:MAG: hypothetical protein QNJ51_16355 [Calothrix sp. MO_167.B12]|nr:hypothetical protein [Calothrix sp. MO_167.B12]